MTAFRCCRSPPSTDGASVNGGPYSEGEFPGGGRFGVVEVTDTGGDTIGVDLTGFDWEGTVLTSFRTTFDVP